MSNASIYTDRDQAAIMAPIAEAFVGLRDGSNRIAHWNLLVAAMNIGVVRSESIGQQAVELFKAAQRALLDADATFDALRIYTFTQGALVDLAKGVAGYAEMLRESTPAQMEAARNAGQARLAKGHIAVAAGTTVH